MGLLVDAATGIENWWGNSEPSEPDYDYASDWLANRPDKAWFTSPIFPGGFDEEGYDEAFNEWIRKKPLSGFPLEME